MKRAVFLATALGVAGAIASSASSASAQALAKWEKFDFAHQHVDSAQLAKLSLPQLRSVRGIVFGRHGRPFTDEPDVQAYLKTQAWYRPNPKFSNASLSSVEKANIDVIRRAEMTKHSQIETGDVRYLADKPITVKMLGHHTAPDWEVLQSEISATHGASFGVELDEEGNDVPSALQKYFDKRYWYHARADYDAKQLSAVERANLDTITLAMVRDLGYGVAPGMMYLFRTTPLTDSLLRGQPLYNLRLMRNEFYARHGRRFETPWLREYFKAAPWYKPRADFTIAELSQTEKDNVKLIQAAEAKRHEALSTTEIDENQLQGLFPEVARRLRNEVFARHGRTFKDPLLQSYFASQEWYHANPKFDLSMLTPIERRNVATIQRYEARAREGQRFTPG
ncbi:MAG TPA: YARHG domain-containing protein [Gemmatimonadaceae bacterium]|nr:YARHG domain-containing protein [Gemmatimonadaceae bacterium]